MASLFQPYETVDTRQVIDLFENHFLKSVFRAAAGKSLAKSMDKSDLIRKRKDALLAAIMVFDEVRQKGFEDNPEDSERIVIEGNKALNKAIKHVPRIMPDDEQETAKIFIQGCNAKKMEFKG